MTQGLLDFTSPAPINVERLSGQNRRLYDYLMTGARINCFSDAMRKLRIGYLNSRRSDLVNKHNVPIQDEFVTVPDVDGNPTTVKNYWLPETYLQNHAQDQIN